MAHHGYIPMMKNFLHRLETTTPAILEIGVDRGTTLFPLASFLSRTRQQFVIVSVDVMIQEPVNIVIQNLDLAQSQQVFLVQGNSLEVLPKLVSQGLKFDLVLIDGDHNYHTVKNELSFLNDICHKHSLVVIDDYEGRWSDKDLWYSEREDYKNVKDASKRIETEKRGVKIAVDDYLRLNPEWKTAMPLGGEPILLTRANT